MGLLDKAKQAGSAAKNMAAEKSGALKNIGSDKIKEIIDELNKALPYIEQAGYVLDDLEIALGIPPKLVTHFDKQKDLSESEKNRLLDQIKETKLTHMLVSSLFKADELQKGVKVGALKFQEIEIEIGLIPAVILHFRK